MGQAFALDGRNAHRHPPPAFHAADQAFAVPHGGVQIADTQKRTGRVYWKVKGTARRDTAAVHIAAVFTRRFGGNLFPVRRGCANDADHHFSGDGKAVVKTNLSLLDGENFHGGLRHHMLVRAVPRRNAHDAGIVSFNVQDFHFERVARLCAFNIEGACRRVGKVAVGCVCFPADFIIIAVAGVENDRVAAMAAGGRGMRGG